MDSPFSIVNNLSLDLYLKNWGEKNNNWISQQQKIKFTTIIIDHDVNEELEKKIGVSYTIFFPKFF